MLCKNTIYCHNNTHNLNTINRLNKLHTKYNVNPLNNANSLNSIDSLENANPLNNGKYNPYNYFITHNLINQIGGVNINAQQNESKICHELELPDNESNKLQKGGANKSNNVFNSLYKLYLIADATDNNLINNYHARLDKLKISKFEQMKMKPHISMMDIQINKANPDHRYIIDANGHMVNKLKHILTVKYHQLSPQMYLTSKKGKYQIMGEFMAKVYTAVNSSYITQFRMSFYKYLEHHLGLAKRSVKYVNGKKYYVYSYNNRELIAIPDYYHGKGIWTPHLSLIKLDKIQKYNPQLYYAYQKNGINALIYALAGVKGSLDHINMSLHFNSLRISII